MANSEASVPERLYVTVWPWTLLAVTGAPTSSPGCAFSGTSREVWNPSPNTGAGTMGVKVLLPPPPPPPPPPPVVGRLTGVVGAAVTVMVTSMMASEAVDGL